MVLLSLQDILKGVKHKMTGTPFPKRSNKKTEILDIIYSDISGAMRVESNGKITFTADCFK